MAPVPPNEREPLAERTLTLCRVLVEHGGRASGRVVAQALGVSLPRLGGVLARIASVLHAEGDACLSHERRTDDVVLDEERFRALFGVSWK